MGKLDDRVADDLILERMLAKEQVLLDQADGLDTKASYLIVVIAFLAQISTTLMSRPELRIWQKVDQWASCGLLVASLSVVLVELKVTPFSSTDAISLDEWRDKAVAKEKDNDRYSVAVDKGEHLRKMLIWAMIDTSKDRISRNEIISGKKVCYLNWAYWLTATAFATDAIFLAALLY